MSSKIRADGVTDEQVQVFHKLRDAIGELVVKYGDARMGAYAAMAVTATLHYVNGIPEDDFIDNSRAFYHRAKEATNEVISQLSEVANNTGEMN